VKDFAIFAVAVALLLLAAAVWTSDRYEFEANGDDGLDSLRLDKHTGEVCVMRFGVYGEAVAIGVWKDRARNHGGG
jgi:hypothetical protein